ncbi:MAG: T9SS type A sorting domain-containing protein [Chitinophagales bacterium]|nr:T9SS type A sorting domain-containing protein [Chitinophagales bacterium]
MKRIIITLACLFAAFVANAQNNNWVNVLGGEVASLANQRGIRVDTASCCPQQAWQMDPNFSSYVGITNPGIAQPFQGLVPLVDPNGGAHSVSLGYNNWSGPANFGAAMSIRVRDTVLVDSFHYYLRFSVAAMRQTWQGMGSDDASPSFTVRDLSGNVLPLTNTLYYNGTNSYNWQKATFDTSMQFLPWDEQVINLSSYIGQTVLIEYGIKNYENLVVPNSEVGLFDLRSAGTLVTTESYCGGTSLLLTAPVGAFDSVVWKNNLGQLIGRGKSHILTNINASNVGDSIEMILYPYMGQGVIVHHWHTLKIATAVFKAAAFSVSDSCASISTQFHFVGDTSLISNYLWDFGDPSSGSLNSATTTSPSHAYQLANNYWIKLKVSNVIGCMDSTTVKVNIVNSPIISAGPNVIACPLQSVQITASIGNPSNCVWNWHAANSSTTIANVDSLVSMIQLLNASDILTFQVLDTIHQCRFTDTLSATLQTLCINHKPIANDEVIYIATSFIGASLINVASNDFDTDGSVSPQGNMTTSTIQLLQNASHGTVTNYTTSEFAYSRANGYTGLDTFSYILSDNGIPNLTDTALVILHILNPISTNTPQVVLNKACLGTVIQLNPPLISGGSGNFSYTWSAAPGSSMPQLSCTNCVSPFFTINANQTVRLSVTDNLLDSQLLIVDYIATADSLLLYANSQVLLYGDSLYCSPALFYSTSPIASLSWTPALNCGSCSAGFFVTSQTSYMHFQAINAGGCSLQDSFIVEACSNDCVWPGDANHDGIVDNFDLLNIGLGYGWNGTPRTGGLVFSFIGQPAYDWGITTAPSIDAKHADYDGNGLIDANDTLGVSFYYSLTHPKQSSTNGIPLTIEFSTTTAVNGDHVYADIHVGSPSIPADSIYGVAFTFAFDTNVVVSNVAYIHSLNANWLATAGTDGLDMAFNQFNSNGELHYAIVRTDHTVKSGNGPVARADMDIQTGNIAGKGNQLKHYNFIAHLKHVRIVDLHGNERTYTLGSDTIVVNYFTGISQLKANQVLSIAPNPANDILKVQSIFPLTNASWSLMDMKGATVVSGNRLTQQGASISTKELKNGVYLLQINAAEGVWQETVIVQH